MPMFISSTYRLYILLFTCISSSRLNNSLSYHTINTCARTPVSSIPMAPPLFCCLSSLLNRYVCFVIKNVRHISTDAISNFCFPSSLMSVKFFVIHGEYLSFLSFFIPLPVILGRGPLLLLRTGHMCCN